MNRMFTAIIFLFSNVLFNMLSLIWRRGMNTFTLYNPHNISLSALMAYDKKLYTK